MNSPADLPGLRALIERMNGANRSVLVGVPAGDMEGGAHARTDQSRKRFQSTRTRVAIRQAKERARREFMATDDEIDEGPLRSVFRRHLSEAVKQAGAAAGARASASAAAKSNDAIPLATIAAIHEFGSPDHNIPERSFLRAGIRRGMPKFRDVNFDSLRKVVLGKMPVEAAIERLGVVAVGEVKREFVVGRFKPLKPETIKRKGSSRPLIDTAQLRQSITYVVEGKQSAKARII